MSEKKVNKIRKTASVNASQTKQTDQFLGSFSMFSQINKKENNVAINSNPAVSNVKKNKSENTANGIEKSVEKKETIRRQKQRNAKYSRRKKNTQNIENLILEGEKLAESKAVATAKKETSGRQNTKRKTDNSSKTRRKTQPKIAEETDQIFEKLIAPIKQENEKTVNKNVSKSRKQNTGSNRVKNNKSNRKPKNETPVKEENKPSIKAYFLGGLNEIGKNFTLFECEEDMILVDCGLTFPDDDMPGIDAVIPDFTFVEENISKVKALFITHGHEDHIGAVPYLLKKFNIPVYGTALTLGLVETKLKEFGLDKTADLRKYNAGDHIIEGCFNVEFVHVNHSVADSVALAIRTPAGLIVHTGDFKIDYTPVEDTTTDLTRFAELGKEGVLALLADSTNAEREGYTQTEQKVSATLESMFDRAGHKRIIVATFASSVSRVQMIINSAVSHGRKVALSGRSMVNVVNIASTLGYMKIPENVIIELSEIKNYNDEDLVLITTGSQGEPMSALTRMAFAEHRQVEVGKNDFIIISARPIPGNEKTIGNVVDELLKRGCEVIYESMYDLHVSGHACQEELKLIHALVKPKYFIPVHGEQKHLRKHAKLAYSMGMPEENVFIGDVGSAVEINEKFMKQLPNVTAGSVFVDGIGVGDVGNIVLRDRKLLAEDGLIVAVLTLDHETKEILSGPEIVSRGFVYVRESEEMMEDARRIVNHVIDDCIIDNITEWNAIKTKVKDGLSRYFYEKTKRNPMILTVIMEV